jgi:predicted Zn-dependent protease
MAIPALPPGPPSAALSRRAFLRLASQTAVGLHSGCAVNPVTRQRQLMLVSEDVEIQVDRQNAPHQLSADYGDVQDPLLREYLAATGRRLVPATHRPGMPYAFHAVNAVYVNAYAFPGGTIAATRGILLELENEAELAALLGHELGHVNARHTANQMSKAMLSQAVIGGASALVGTQSRALGELAGQLGMVSAGALLASYSRDNEREADALGLRYMARTGYNPEGFQGLMDLLRSLNQHNPSAIEMMFATHPMSEERYQNAAAAIRRDYAAAQNQPLYRERYMDHTAGLRRLKDAVAALQEGEKQLARKQYTEASGTFGRALKTAPGDYTALVMMAKCQLLMDRPQEAARYAEEAQAAYPAESQALHVGGIAHLRLKRFDAALEDFARCAQVLPGNPQTIFFRGFALEGLQRRPEAARDYHAFLQTVTSGAQAQHAYGRLVEWGYVKR